MSASSPAPNQLGEFPIGAQKLVLNGNTLGLVPDGNSVNLSHVPPSNPLIVSAEPTNTEARATIRNTNTTGTTKLELANKDGTYTFYQTNATGGGLTQDHLQLYSYFPTPQAVLDIDPTGNMTLNNGTLQAQNAKITAPVNQVLLPNMTGPSIQGGNLRPLFWDVATNKLTIPTSPLIRYFYVSTPDATGNEVTITDPLGGTYNSNDWTCCVAGFYNQSSDRTYNAFTIPYAGAPWKCRYDQAGSGGRIAILAISNQLLSWISF
jgi:hypothetical protein